MQELLERLKQSGISDRDLENLDLCLAMFLEAIEKYKAYSTETLAAHLGCKVVLVARDIMEGKQIDVQEYARMMLTAAILTARPDFISTWDKIRCVEYY